MYARNTVFALMFLGSCSAASSGEPATGSDSVNGSPQELAVCVVVNGALRIVGARQDPVTGDTLIGDRRWNTVFPTTTPPYAEGAAWLSEPFIQIQNLSYAPYGPARQLPADALALISNVEGVPVFVESGTRADPPGMVFLPLRPGCWFQPYIGIR